MIFKHKRIIICHMKPNRKLTKDVTVKTDYRVKKTDGRVKIQAMANMSR